MFVYQRHSKTEGRSRLELSHRDVHGFCLPPPAGIAELQCAPSSVEFATAVGLWQVCGRWMFV